jgi:uncharacterized hydrophobic protein (TIGR00271 family)
MVHEVGIAGGNVSEPTDNDAPGADPGPEQEPVRPRFAWRALVHPLVARTGLMAALSVAAWMWPQRSALVLARLLASGLIVLGITRLWMTIRARPVPAQLPTSPVAPGTDHVTRERLGDGAVGVLLLVSGVVVLMLARSDPAVLGRLSGGVLIVVAFNTLHRAQRSREHWGFELSQGVVLAGVGVLVIVYPDQMISILIAVAAALWIAASLVVATHIIRDGSDNIHSYSDVAHLIAVWLNNRRSTAAERHAVYDKVFFHGEQRWSRLVRFGALMLLASVISTMGIITNSTAVVIGAMLIAPLMTPLMGMAIGLVMGWPRHLALSALVAACSVAGTVGVGFVLGTAFAEWVTFATNAQISARILPTTLDLVIALAAGAAGAYGLSRPDVAEALPGVAVAIALVPPLSVVGVSLAVGRPGAAAGALLLFATNAVAILVFGGLIFVLTGITPVRRVSDQQYRMRTITGSLAVLALVVVGLLMLNGAQIAGDALAQNTAVDVVESWLDEYPDHETVRATLTGSTVEVIVRGPEAGVPDAASLAARLAERFDREMKADVRLLIENRATAVAEP